MIDIDEAAKIKIREMYSQNPGKYLRIAVDGDGCAGPYFGFSLDEPGSNEEPAKVNGIEVLISDAVQRYADVTTIKVFVNPGGGNSKQKAGTKIRNPNVEIRKKYQIPNLKHSGKRGE